MLAKWKLPIIAAAVLLVIISVIFLFQIGAPANFPAGSMFTIEKGSGLNLLGTKLSENKIIRSPFLFKAFSVIFGGTKGIIAGDYVLSGSQSVIAIAKRFSSGDFQLAPVKITIPEGLNVFEISKLISGKFSKIDPDSFVKSAGADEGYLFPDTYFFLPNAQAVEIIKTMKDNFQEKIKALNTEISNYKKPLPDVIKMASILEEEARTTETRRVVAGILWKRLALGMPLQVDASFKYINGKVTSSLTLDDLKIDSPYNSYLYRGLPPTPISNPGLDSISASVRPIKTNYLYFLTDKDGNMHYARTYEEHLLNKEAYLK
jgi:UPF0755 protein